MSRVYNNIVAKRFYFVLQAFVHHARKIFFAQVATEEIRAANIAHKECVTCKYAMGFASFVMQKVACTFQSGPGCMQHLYLQLSNSKLFTVFSNVYFK